LRIMRVTRPVIFSFEPKFYDCGDCRKAAN
jgi:hypothetical protein